MTVRLPALDSRTAILGATGSGKTTFGMFLLSLADFTSRPWIILDTKRDPSLRQIDAIEISLDDPVPVIPDLYILRPTHDEDLEPYLWQIYEAENVGLFVDEGYSMPSGKRSVFRALLAHGRSKNIQMIILSQRPVDINLSVFTESQFFAVFDLNRREDRNIVSNYLWDCEIEGLPRYHCLWYDINNKEHVTFEPVPSPAEISGRINRRLAAYRNSAVEERRPVPL